MKTLIASLALLFGVAAQAETVTLGSVACSPTNFCAAVPNNKKLTIDYINVSTAQGRLTLQVDGVIYDSGIYAVAGLSQTDVVVHDANGVAATVTVMFSVTTKPCYHSGRVSVCPRFVTLESGTLILP